MNKVELGRVIGAKAMVYIAGHYGFEYANKKEFWANLKGVKAEEIEAVYQDYQDMEAEEQEAKLEEMEAEVEATEEVTEETNEEQEVDEELPGEQEDQEQDTDGQEAEEKVDMKEAYRKNLDDLIKTEMNSDGHFIAKKDGYLVKFQISRKGIKIRCNAKMAKAIEEDYEYKVILHDNWNVKYELLCTVGEAVEVFVALTGEEEE